MTPIQQAHLSLIRRIKNDPYYGTAIRECSTCGGGGKCYRGEPSQGTEDCPDCNGTGTTFREWLVCGVCKGTGNSPGPYGCIHCKGEGRVPDKAGREVVAAAVEKWIIKQPSETRRRFCNAYRGFDWSLGWDSRHDQPYQKPLETYVREYEQPPLDLESEAGFWFLMGVLHIEGFGYGVGRNSMDSNLFAWVETEDRIYEVEDVPNAPAALLAACEAAWPEKGAGE